MKKQDFEFIENHYTKKFKDEVIFKIIFRLIKWKKILLITKFDAVFAKSIHRPFTVCRKKCISATTVVGIIMCSLTIPNPNLNTSYKN